MTVQEILQRQTVLQQHMKNRREQFVEPAFIERLYNAYVQNRYLQQEYKNPFEVRRIWDKLTQELVETLIISEDVSTWHHAIIQILVGNAETLSSTIQKYGTKEEQEQLTTLLRTMKDFYATLSHKEYRLLEEQAQEQKQREVQFMELMLEMMDRLEIERASQ